MIALLTDSYRATRSNFCALLAVEHFTIGPNHLKLLLSHALLSPPPPTLPMKLKVSIFREELLDFPAIGAM